MGALQDLENAETAQLAQWEQRLERVIRAKGGTVSAREFQRAVNVLFHDAEAGTYDKIHREMWDSLPPVFERLATDVAAASDAENHWTLLDVGCGTGLATDFLLATALRPRLTTLRMLDTSKVMLNSCRARAENWAIPTEFIHGEIDTLAGNSADLIVTSSVLHHLPDLVSFCKHVVQVLRPGGFYLHLHDPCRGALESPSTIRRSARLVAVRKQKRARSISLPARITRGITERIRRLFRSDYAAEYLDEVNRRLIAAGLIKKPLSPHEIWSVTDLRLGEMPYAAADGISMDELAVALEGMELVSSWTYGFHGVLSSNLPPELEHEERRLFEERSNEGMFLAGVWRCRA
jgi:SAM-dependent methyltransferase